MKRILIPGALGQIGSELITFLRKRYGNENVVASDIKPLSEGIIKQEGPFEHIDCLDAQEIYSIIKKYKIDTVFHLAYYHCVVLPIGRHQGIPASGVRLHAHRRPSW